MPRAPPKSPRSHGRVRAWESLSYATACLVVGLLLDLYGVTLALPVYGAAAA